MKKFSGVNLLRGLTVILVLIFIVKTIIDYVRYSSTLNSAPFHIWIFLNAIYYILPAIVALIISTLIKKHKQ